jgi:hypothetical protein
MSFRTLLRFAVGTTLILLLSPSVSSAQFAWGLVNRVLHAEARTGNIVDLPPDLVLGTNFGSFSHSAQAINPPYVAEAEVSSWMLSNGMQARLAGEASARLTIDPMAHSSVLMEFDVFAASAPFRLTFYMNQPLGPPEFGGLVEIRRAGGGPVVFTHHMEQLLGFPPPQPTEHTFNLPAGQYEMLVSGSPFRHMGQGAGGEGFFRMTGPRIPEPASVGALMGALGLAALRPRRR